MKNEMVKLNDTELKNVSGGDIKSAYIVGAARPYRKPIREPLTESVLTSMPPKIPNEKYVMGVDPTDIQIVSNCGPTSLEY